MNLFNRSVATANLGSLQPFANGFSKNNSSNILSANIGSLQLGRRTVFDPKTQGDSYTLGGNTYISR